MRKVVQQIPNLITSGNILSGCFSIIAAFNGHLEVASFLIILGAIFDFFDGMVARLLHAQSDIGLQMDSLADMITFGLAPSVIIFQMISNTSLHIAEIGGYSLFAYFAFLHAVFAAFRLAKLNVDTRQTSSFIGLPSPASALIILSFPLILKYQSEAFLWVDNLLYNPWFLLIITIFCGIMMVVELPLFSMKFKGTKDPDNRIRLIYIILAVLILAFFRFIGIPMVIILYIILSIVRRALK